MKLYYSPFSCSLSPHIVLRELDLTFTLDRVDSATKTAASGVDYLTVNPNGYVPALELDDGEILTEGPAIVQHLVDAFRPGTLAPPAGTIERARVNRWLAFIATELHKPSSALFDRSLPPAVRATTVARLDLRFGFVDDTLGDGRAYLTGDMYSLADIYLFVVQNWAPFTGYDLSRFRRVRALADEIAARPAVRAAIAQEA